MTPSGKTSDLIVVGGGVVGLAVAREAAGRGLDVTVVERTRPGRAASWAAAGMLSPLGEAREGSAFLEFGLASLRTYPAWARELEEESGVEVDYEEGGKLRVALTAEGVEDLASRRRWAREQGVAHRWLDGAEVAEAHPDLAPGIRAGLAVDEDHRVDNRRLGQALEAAARRRGVRIREGCTVREIALEGGRVRGVLLDDDSTLPAGAVVVAAGAWSGRIGGLPRPVPVRPVRGQILALRPEKPPSRRVLESEGIYLVPRKDGRLIVGATQEEAGFDQALTAEGVRGLLERAVGLAPALAAAPIHEIWCGLRPGTPDGQPILGPVPEVEGLVLATGHFRNGILLAPLSARVVADLLTGGEPPPVPGAFLPGRFAEGGVGA